METVPSLLGKGADLYAQAECETSNDLVGEPLPIDARFYILESRRLQNGAKRARVVLKGQETPFGWLTQQSPDGRAKIRSVYARPLYQVVRLAIVRRRFELTSEEVGTLPVGSKLHIVETRRTPEGAQRVCVVLVGQDKVYGWLTARKPHQCTVTLRAIPDDPSEGGDSLDSPDMSRRLSLPLPLYAASPESARERRPSSRSPSKSSPSSARGERYLPPFASSTPRKALHSASGFGVDQGGSPPTGRNGQRSARSIGSGGSSRSGSPSRSLPGSPVPFGRTASPDVAEAVQGDGQDPAKSGNLWQNKLGLGMKMRKPSASTMSTSADLQVTMNEYIQKAEAEDAKLDDSKKTLPVKLGEALVMKKVKVGELVQTWAKRGEEPISKMEFRQHVRKLLGKPDSKQVDALFEALDEDHGGSLEVSELKSALKKLQDAASKSGEQAVGIREQAAFFRGRAAVAKEAVDATAISEQVVRDLGALKSNRSVEARLGMLLSQKVGTMKINDVVSKWDASGDGDISKGEFRKQVKAYGLMAESWEIDGLFESLDADGGGSLDHAEMKRALKQLMDTAAAADKDMKRLQKQLAEVNASARSAQGELKKVVKLDQEAAALEAERLAKEAEEKAQKILEQKAARAAAQVEKEKQAEEERAAFEAKVAARRGGLPAAAK